MKVEFECLRELASWTVITMLCMIHKIPREQATWIIYQYVSFLGLKKPECSRILLSYILFFQNRQSPSCAARNTITELKDIPGVPRPPKWIHKSFEIPNPTTQKINIKVKTGQFFASWKSCLFLIQTFCKSEKIGWLYFKYSLWSILFLFG